MRLFFGLGLGLSFLLASGLDPKGALGQECPTGEISYIFIDNTSIFDLPSLEPDTPFRWAYRLANTLHMRTREGFIRDELLFRVGECLDTLRLEETERLLRSYRFIAQSDVFALRQPDGTQHVNVFTQDEWTTRVDVGLEVDEGFRFTGVEVTEENLLGRGILARVFFEEQREARNAGMELQTSRIFNTRWDTRVSVGSTRTGNFFEEAVLYPFLGEIGRFGARQSFSWRETLFAFAIPDDASRTHLLLPFLDEHADLAVGWRLGRPGSLTVLGLGFSRESTRFRGFPAGVEYLIGKNFDDTEPVDPSGRREILSQAQSRRANRINVFLGRRNLRFVQRRGLDAMRGIQDVQVGTEVFLGFGRAPRFFQEGGRLSLDDLHTQASIFGGRVWGPWTLNTQLFVEARQEWPDEGEDTEWRDIFAEADAYLYWQPRTWANHTILFRASAAGGWSVETPFQLTLGGRYSVRGYREESFPGGRRVVLSLEDRMYLPWPAPNLFDFGFSFFLDVGRIQSGDAPFGVSSGWQAALGVGARFGLPPGTRTMNRIDLAVPLKRKLQLKDLVLRLSLRELLGLLPGMRDIQILRSLRSGLKPDLVFLPW